MVVDIALSVYLMIGVIVVVFYLFCASYSSPMGSITPYVSIFCFRHIDIRLLVHILHVEQMVVKQAKTTAKFLPCRYLFRDPQKAKSHHVPRCRLGVPVMRCLCNLHLLFHSLEFGDDEKPQSRANTFGAVNLLSGSVY